MNITFVALLHPTFSFLRVINYTIVINYWICDSSLLLQHLWHIDAITDYCEFINDYHLRSGPKRLKRSDAFPIFMRPKPSQTAQGDVGCLPGHVSPCGQVLRHNSTVNYRMAEASAEMSQRGEGDVHAFLDEQGIIWDF